MSHGFKQLVALPAWISAVAVARIAWLLMPTKFAKNVGNVFVCFTPFRSLAPRTTSTRMQLGVPSGQVSINGETSTSLNDGASPQTELACATTCAACVASVFLVM